MADDIEKQIDVVDGTITKEEADTPDYQPVYQMYENTRIPVSKSMGKLWKSRKEEAMKLNERTGVKDRWDEAIRYYQNDQGGRSGKRNRLSELGRGKSHDPAYTSENIVFANVSALVPSVYAKNPDVTITATDTADEKQGKLFERLIGELFRRKITPGINLRRKMKRLVVTTMLTNIAYVELSYVRKEDSSEQAIQEIEALSKQLAEATKPDEIREIEGKLQALEEKISVLTASGPRCRIVNPDMVFVDPNNEDPDPCNGDFMIIGEYIRTNYLRAVFGKKENGEWMSIYKPTHVLAGDSDSQGHDDEINNFTLLTDGEEHTKYGYKDEDSFKQSCRTLVWYVWDKTTRRVMMFNDHDWSWPIWVWDDPYNLSRFYPLFALSFYIDPKDMHGRSEIMYYLDQQDEINQINTERARMRHWAMSKVFVNSNFVKDATKVEKFLGTDTDQLVYAIDLPDGKKISDVIGTFPAPSTQFEGLFDPRPILEGVNRLSSVTPVLQNVQYKTNTTNRAIESYESSTQTRLDEKIDEIEDLLSDVAQALIEMCIQFMTEEEVVALLGESFVQQNGGWVQTGDIRTFNTEYNLNIVGGSTLKPTAKVKKEQAMQLGQILGQFANAAPMLVIVMLKMLQRAFGDDVIITDEEWNTVVESTSMQMQRGVSTQGGGQQQQQPQEGQQQQQQGGDINAMMTQVEAVINRLPPQAKQFLGAGIAKGVPLKQLVMELTQAAQQQQQQPQQ